MSEDLYYTIKNEASAELRVKGSRFIGYAGLVRDSKEAEAFIQKISKKNHDATHNCYGYRLGRCDDSSFRYYDDGEPSGTAGKPILSAIDGRVLSYTICVVSRYFGGTKLGTGGLSRAYHQCAADVLERAGIRKVYYTKIYRIICSYEFTGRVMSLIDEFGCRVVGTHYSNEMELEVEVRCSLAEKFTYELKERCCGNISIMKSKESV